MYSMSTVKALLLISSILCECSRKSVVTAQLSTRVFCLPGILLSGAIPSQHVGTFNPDNEDPVAAAAIGGGGVALCLIVVICMCVWSIIFYKCCNQTDTPSVTQTSQGNYTVDGVRVHHYPASEGITYTPRTVRSRVSLSSYQ